ncbi:MAG: hypothetical protein ACK5PP_16460 [Acidimicrobiales bacterium]
MVLLSGDTGADYVALGDGDDLLSGAGDGSTVYGGVGDDTISASASVDVRAYGGDGDDHVEADYAGGGAGLDSISGRIEAWGEDGEADLVAGGTCFVDDGVDDTSGGCDTVR